MFSYDLSDKLRKRVRKLAKKDKVLALIFKRKIKEVITHNTTTIDTYKNLHSPQNEYKRIHLTNNFILLSTIDRKNEHIIFVGILHWDKAYK